MEVILYSTDCPKCSVLETKLNQKNIEYKTIRDIDLMVKKGFMNMPVLEVNGEVMEFKEAVGWVNEV